MNEKEDNIKIITGDPKKAILKLSWPTMISMLLTMLYNIVDIIWISGLGPDYLSTMGFIMPLFLILTGFGSSLGAGANSLIARYIGANNIKQANNAALHGILLSIILSVILTTILLLFMPQILMCLGVGNVLKYAMEYSYIVFGALFIFIFFNVASAIFRSEGDVKRATISIAITAVLNIILDPILIYVCGWGMIGAAWATVISVTLTSLIMAYWIWYKQDLFLDLSLKNFSFEKKMIYDELQVAFPSFLQTLLISGLAIIINMMLVEVGGTNAVGVYSASLNIIQLANIPLLGIGMAVLTVSGIAYGACDYENLKTTLNYSLKISFLLSLAMGVFMVVFSSQIASIFTYSDASTALAPYVSDSIKILSFYVVAIPLGLMSSMIFQGMGKGIYALIFTFLRVLVLQGIFAYIFSFVIGWGVIGIYVGLILGCFTGSVLAYIWVIIIIKRFGENLNSNNLTSENESVQ